MTSSSEAPKFIPQNVAHNKLLIYKCKVFTSLLFGLYAGLYGLLAFQGLSFFFLIFILTSVLIKSMVQIRTAQTVTSEIADLWMYGLADSFLTFVLFWTLAYNGKWLFRTH